MPRRRSTATTSPAMSMGTTLSESRNEHGTSLPPAAGTGTTPGGPPARVADPVHSPPPEMRSEEWRRIPGGSRGSR